MTETVSVDKLVSAYIRMRDKRSELLREYEEADGAIKQKMEVVEARLLDVCREIGADNIGSQHGTVIRTVKTRYWTTDWESMYRFIADKNMPNLLERRISQSTMKQMLEENPDLLPPGVNIDSRYAVTIKRKSGAST
jgi:hypothetical protein